MAVKSRADGSAITTRRPAYAASVSQRVKDEEFGVVVEGIEDVNDLSDAEFSIVEQLLYRHGFVVLPGARMTPSGQYKITKQFDPSAVGYGHDKVADGTKKVKSVLAGDGTTIPGTPVQLIGNGVVTDESITQGLPVPVKLKHPDHRTFHRSVISDERSAAGFTRFYRWHVDAALYNLSPPRVTTLHGIVVPKGPRQTVLYDDGSHDELEVPVGGTAFISGALAFDVLSAEEKSLAVRTKVVYAPWPYVWLTSCKSRPTGLGLETEGLELSRDELPPFDESKILSLPMCWKNLRTGALHLQVHPSGVESLVIDPLPSDSPTAGALYPEGGHLTDLKAVRDLVYRLQRPGIAPGLVVVHDWSPYDLVIFHNRGVLHSVLGAIPEDVVRASYQCNLAASDPVVGPNEEDLKRWA